MAKLAEAFNKLMKFRAVKWAGYLVWIAVLSLILSFVWGNSVENQPRAAFIGGIMFVIILELGIGIRMIVKYVLKKKLDRKDGD